MTNLQKHRMCNWVIVTNVEMFVLGLYPTLIAEDPNPCHPKRGCAIILRNQLKHQSIIIGKEKNYFKLWLLGFAFEKQK